MLMTNNRGEFITFEGGEGGGKTMQIAHAASYLKSLGIDVLLLRDPGGTSISDQIRSILVDSKNEEIDPMVELLLYLASRRQLTQEKIEPALKRGQWVLCDRYADSTWVYQGFTKLGTYMGHQDGIVTVRNLNLIAETSAAGIEPNLTVLFDVPVEIGLGRAKSRASALPENKREDRFERKALDFHQKIRDGFLRRAKECVRIVVVDAQLGLDEVARSVENILDSYIAGMELRKSDSYVDGAELRKSWKKELGEK